MFIQAPIGEELGWRRFALPGLQARHGPLAGTLILGVLHALWHLPAWLFAGGAAGGTPSGFAETALLFPGCAAMIVASAFVYTWVANHSRGSVLLAMLFHEPSNHDVVRLFIPDRFQAPLHL